MPHLRSCRGLRRPANASTPFASSLCTATTCTTYPSAPANAAIAVSEP